MWVFLIFSLLHKTALRLMWWNKVHKKSVCHAFKSFGKCNFFFFQPSWMCDHGHINIDWVGLQWCWRKVRHIISQSLLYAEQCRLVTFSISIFQQSNPVPAIIPVVIWNHKGSVQYANESVCSRFLWINQSNGLAPYRISSHFSSNHSYTVHSHTKSISIHNCFTVWQIGG